MANEARILFMDLETGPSLNADFGVVLCMGYKWADDKKVKLITLLDHPGKHYTDDKPLMKEIAKVWNQADVVVTWYGLGHDEPFLITRTLKHRLPPLKEVYHLDLWKTARKRFKLRNNRLVTVSEFFGTSEHKNAIQEDAWLRVLAGDKKAMRYIADHCRRDVEVLEEVYYRMRPYIKSHPRVAHGDMGSCRFCGSERLHKRGITITAAKGKAQRVQCQECGGWDNRTMGEVKKFKLIE